ncbi:MAG: Lrp/AsnC family transcriptional regulator [bacterium]|nr:Lrp/AsnC family transcriptional regulator [bacterium]
MILEILEYDSRSTPAEISKQVNIPEKEVEKYIAKFEKDGIIVGYKTLINWQRVKQHDVKALIEVKVTPERNVGFDAVAEAIYKYPEVSSLYLLSGGYDLLVQVEGTNLREVALFVSEKLATIKGVQSTVSHFLLKKYKEDGVEFVDRIKSKRLPVTP